MRTRQICIAAVALLALAGCNGNRYQIDGIYTAEDGTDVWLIDLQTKDTLSQTSVQDGHFGFEGRLKEPIFAYVGNGKQRVQLILEPGIVLVDIDERTASGTPMQDNYMTFHRRFYGYGRNQRQEKGDLVDSMVRAQPDNIAGALALEDLASVDTSRFLLLREVLSAPLRDFYLVQSAYESIQRQSRTAPGHMFTDYLVEGGNPDGSDVRLSDYVGRGKWILLDHWASWCGPCKAEMPYIKKTWEAFHGELFEVVSIAVSDKREDTQAALTQLDMPWSQILDGKRIPLEIYGVNAIPHLILFAPDGTIHSRGLRGDEIYDTIAQLLAIPRQSPTN